MSDAKASAAEKDYWRRIAEANERRKRDERPAASMREVFQRMAAIRARLGRLAEAGLPQDEEGVIAENLRLRARWQARASHARQGPWLDRTRARPPREPRGR